MPNPEWTPDDLIRRITRPTGLDERPGLERMRRLVGLMGDPQRGLPVVHVGGTSGKGSTATLVAAILRAAGLRVGLHTKPHLTSVEERFVVDGEPIREEKLLSLIYEAMPAVEATRPTWHELTVALALRHFARESVLGVLEVGLGGEFDSTNVVEAGVEVVTNVGLDHTEVLGHDLRSIARTKSGIIKPDGIVVTAASDTGALDEIERRCREVGAPCWVAGRDFSWHVRDADARGTRIDVVVQDLTLRDLRLQLLGEHQAENASLAAAAAVALRGRGWDVSDAAIRTGLETTVVPGRLEIATREPLVVLDGAHSPPKMAALAAAVRRLFPGRRIVAALAAKRGHDLLATLRHLAPLLRAAVATRYEAAADFGTGTAVAAEDLADTLRAAGGPREIAVEPDAAAALRAAMDVAEPDGIVLVTGSLYLVGQLRPLVLGNETAPKAPYEAAT